MAVTTWRDVEGARRPWAFEQGINDALHQAGKPIENAHVEGFKGRLRECLNQNWFVGCIPEFGRRMPRSWIPQTNGKISYSRFAHRTPSAPPTFLRGRV